MNRGNEFQELPANIVRKIMSKYVDANKRSIIASVYIYPLTGLMAGPIITTLVDTFALIIYFETASRFIGF